MPVFRRLLALRSFAALICVAALAMKLLVPSGYMVSSDHGRVGIILCPGVAPQAAGMAMSEMHHGMPDTASDHAPSNEHGKTELPCAFSSLSAQAVGAVDFILLAAAIAFAMATGLGQVRPPTRQRIRHLRPPLRGPPALVG